MLERGELDALFHVAPAESPLVQRLIAVKGVRLLSFDRAQAYVRRFPFLSSVTLPRGVFDLAGNVPDHDIVLLSPTANLLARDSLHPALAYLLMTAATTVHGEGSLLSARGQFPALLDADFPYSERGRALLQVGRAMAAALPALLGGGAGGPALGPGAAVPGRGGAAVAPAAAGVCLAHALATVPLVCAA